MSGPGSPSGDVGWTPAAATATAWSGEAATAASWTAENEPDQLWQPPDGDYLVSDQGAFLLTLNPRFEAAQYFIFEPVVYLLTDSGLYLVADSQTVLIRT
ncbi:MAG: hypothetical protein ACREFW_06815 [Rhizomicrobium sp.]